MEIAVEFIARQKGGYSSPGKSRGKSRIRNGNSNPPTCYCCGNTGHKRATCRLREAECRKCGRKDHIEVMYRQPKDAKEDVKENEFVGFATTARGDDVVVREWVWIDDLGSMTAFSMHGGSEPLQEL